MIAKATVTAFAVTLASGCVTMRHASQPSLQGVTDLSPYEVRRSGNILTRYSYTRSVDKGQSLDLTPLFDHYDETRTVQQTASRYENVAQWALPVSLAASVAMFGSGIIMEENERGLGIVAVTSAALGALVTTVAHLFGQAEYGRLGELYNGRLHEEAADD